MSNIMQLFEQMGQDAGLQSRSAQQAAIRQAELSTGLRDALLEGNAADLEQALGIESNFICFMVKP